MKLLNIPVLFLLILCLNFTNCKGQTNTNSALLTLEKEIPIPGVTGRIDHIDINLNDQIVYLAALGNNSLEIIDLKKGTAIHSIKGLSEPQGVAYIAKHNEIFIANGGTGECGFYDASTFQKTASIKFNDDADDVRYDEASDKIFVGYGDGGIAIIDAGTHKQTGDIKLPAHPESFQLDLKEGKIWVNLPGAGMIGVADIKQAKLVDKWTRTLPRANFPMAYDDVGHRILVGYRFPATLKVLDSHTGKEIYSSGMVGDVDDFYWDEKTRQIFISGGSGSINVFKQTSDSTYTLVADISTSKGARTSLLVPKLRLFLLAVREKGDKPAALQLYKLN
jgi:DNA-binding beta-propeller fold protein YncE